MKLTSRQLNLIFICALVSISLRFTCEVFSNRKMRLKYFKSCGGFGSTINGLKQSFSSFLYVSCRVIITQSISVVFK